RGGVAWSLRLLSGGTNGRARSHARLDASRFGSVTDGSKGGVRSRIGLQRTERNDGLVPGQPGVGLGELLQAEREQAHVLARFPGRNRERIAGLRRRCDPFVGGGRWGCLPSGRGGGSRRRRCYRF